MVIASITCLLIRSFLVPTAYREHTRAARPQTETHICPCRVLQGGLSNPSLPFLSSRTGLAILGPPKGALSPLVIYCLACPGAAQDGLSSSVQAWPGLCSWTHDPLPSGDHQGGYVSDHTGWILGGFLPIPGQASIPLFLSSHLVSPLASLCAGGRDTSHTRLHCHPLVCPLLGLTSAAALGALSTCLTACLEGAVSISPLHSLAP